MERHFVLPVTFAAAFHAALLFAFRPSAVSASSDHLKIAKSEHSKPSIEVDLDQPKPETTTEEKITPKGDSDTPRPTLPEMPAVDATERISVNIPHTERSVSVAEKFDLKSFGKPDGAENIIDVRTALTGVGQLDNPPRARLQARPNYPAEARRSQQTGEVLVEFIVDESGAVVSPRVVHSTDRIFVDATLRAVAQWRFEPGKRGGKIVRFRMAVPVVFNLNDN